MRKSVLAIAVVFLLSGLVANAQQKDMKMDDKDKQQEMMSGKMMQDKHGMEPMENMNMSMMQGNMMSSICPMCHMMMNQDMPLKKYFLMANHIPEMQQQLDLTDEQVNMLINLRSEFKKQQVDFEAELFKKRMKMEKLLESNASTADLRGHMNKCAEVRVDMKLSAYETVHQMKDLLNEKQRGKLKMTCRGNDEMMKH